MILTAGGLGEDFVGGLGPDERLASFVPRAELWQQRSGLFGYRARSTLRVLT
jgi:hypothetical protein